MIFLATIANQSTCIVIEPIWVRVWLETSNAGGIIEAGSRSSSVDMEKGLIRLSTVGLFGSSGDRVWWFFVVNFVFGVATELHLNIMMNQLLVSPWIYALAYQLLT